MGGPVYAVAWDPSGQYLLSGGQDRTITLSRPALSKHITDYTGHGWSVLDISVSMDGRSFCSVGGDRSAFLWDVASNRLLRRFAGHSAQVNAVSCCPDGSDLIITGSSDRTVRIWDKRVYSKFPVQVLEDAADSIETLSIRRPLILTGSADGVIRIYDVRERKMHVDAFLPSITTSQSGKEAPDAVMRIRTGKDGTCYAAMTLSGNLALFDLGESGGILQKYQSPAASTGNTLRIAGMCFGRNEESLIVGASDGCIYSFDIVSGANTKIAEAPGCSPVLCLDYSLKSDRLAFGCLDGSVHCIVVKKKS